MNKLTIKTASGKKTVVRRVGFAHEYYQTEPTESAPGGEWWTLNPQRGFVPVDDNSRGLRLALAE